MEVSRNSFYEWLKGPKGKRYKENEQLREELKKSFDGSNGTYGRRRLTIAVKDSGISCNPSINRVERQMKVLEIEGYRPPSFKRTTIGNPLLQDSPNLARDHKLDGIDQIWVSDITYIRTREGWLYLCSVMDLFSRKIIGWATDANMKAQLVIRAFDMAHRQRRPNERVIFHSDKGGQYKSKKLRRKLKRLGYQQSMTGRNHCYDNAHAESFFGTMKNELIRGVKFGSRAQAESAIFEYVEVYYNRKRIHSSIGNQSPESFENGLLPEVDNIPSFT